MTSYQKSDSVGRCISAILPNFTQIRFETIVPWAFYEERHTNKNNKNDKMTSDMGSMLAVPDPKMFTISSAPRLNR